MLEGGADIRYIQEMLGHSNLQTTEIYTHVNIDKLIAVHKNSHPSRLDRRTTGEEQGRQTEIDLEKAKAWLLEMLD